MPIKSHHTCFEELSQIIKLGEENYFISRQDLEPFLYSVVPNQTELHLIFYSNLGQKTESITSTLSIVFKNGKFYYPNKIEELFRLSKPFIKRPKKQTPLVSSDDIVRKRKKERYLIENSNYHLATDKINANSKSNLICNHVAVIAKSEIDSEILNLIEEACRVFRNASPNLMNASMLLSLRDAEEFAEKYEKSISATVENFRKLIVRIYGVECGIIERNFERNSYESNQVFKNFKFEEFSELLKYGRPVFSKNHKYNYLIFPFCNDRQTFSINHFLVLRSPDPIKRFILTNLSKSTNFYFDSYLSKIRLQHISDLQNKIIQIHSDKAGFVRGINFEEKLKEFCIDTFKPLISMTGVFSATVRFFDPFSEELSLVYEEPETKRIKSRVITAKNRNSSINFLTFDKCKKNQFFYCKDVPLFKKNKEKLSIDRKTTVTELCFPLYFKDVKIGTVNFESPLQQAFGKVLNVYYKKYYFKIEPKLTSDELFNYFLTIKNLIQEFGEILFESNDKFWLVERIQNYQNIHELKSLLLNPKIPRVSKIIIRKAIGVSPNILNKDKKYQLSKVIVDHFNSYFNSMITYSSETLEIMKLKISVIIDENFLITYESKTYLEILLQNLFKNFHTYHDIYDNYELIDIKTVEHNLYITQRFSFRNYSPELKNEYLIKPYHTYEVNEKKENVEITHLGLFFVGMLTRQLRGQCKLNLPEDTYNKNSTLLITIPLINE